MKKLSTLLLKTYIGPFIITFLVAMFVFEMQFIWVYLDDLMGKGLDNWVIIKLLFFASARVVNMALPLAILMSSIMTMGSLGENNELTAMKGAGISLIRIMRPLIFFSIGLSITAFVFANNIWPIANLKTRALLFSIMRQKPSLNLTNGVFYNGIEGISIRVTKNNPETGELKDVLIYDHRGGERNDRTVIRAKEGTMEQTVDKRFLILTLFDGYSYDEQKNSNRKNPSYSNVRNSFEKSVIRIDLSSLAFSADNEELMKNPAEMMTIQQLGYAIDSLQTSMDTAQSRFAEANLMLATSRIGAMNEAENRILPETSLYNQLTSSEKIRAISHAKESSRRIKENVERQSDEMYGRMKYYNRHKIEWHRKFFLAVVCFVLFFIGAPLGAIIRKGGIGLPTLIALSFFIIYELLTMVGENLAKKGIIEPWIGMWMSTLVLLPVSIWITYKATKEAAFIDSGRYQKALKKIVTLFKVKNKRVVV